MATISRVEKITLFTIFLLLPSQLGRHFWPEWAYVNGLRVDYLAPTLWLTHLLVIVLLALWLVRRIFFTLPKQHILQSPGKSFLIFASIGLFLLISSSNPFLASTKLLTFAVLLLFGRYLSSYRFSVTVPLSLAVIGTTILAFSQFISQKSIGGPLYFLGERAFTASTPGIALSPYPDLWSLGFGVWNLYLRPYATFSHPNSMSGFLLVSLILIWKSPLFIARLAKIAAIAGIFLSSSRLAIFTLLTLGIIFFFHRTRSPRLATFFPFVLALYFFLFIAFGLKNPSSSVTDRLAQAKTALSLVRARPLFGVGLGNFIPGANQYVFKKAPVSYSQNRELAYQPVHNIYLLFMAETGLPVSVIAFGYVFFNLFRQKKNSSHQSIPAIALVVILFTGLFDHYWLTLPQNQLLFAITLGLFKLPSSASGKYTP